MELGPDGRQVRVIRHLRSGPLYPILNELK
jgi:hypothetical protein